MLNAFMETSEFDRVIIFENGHMLDFNELFFENVKLLKGIALMLYEFSCGNQVDGSSRVAVSGRLRTCVELIFRTATIE